MRVFYIEFLEDCLHDSQPKLLRRIDLLPQSAFKTYMMRFVLLLVRVILCGSGHAVRVDKGVVFGYFEADFVLETMWIG